MTALIRLRVFLESLAADDLQRRIDARPDVLRGAPVRDLGDLAERLLNHNGVAAALSEASWPQLQVLEVLVAAGAGASLRRTVALLDATEAHGDRAAHASTVASVVAELAAISLVWPRGDALDVNPGARSFLGTPLGLGRPAETVLADIPVAQLTKIVSGWGLVVVPRKAELVAAVAEVLADPVQVRALVATAPPDVADYLLTRAERALRRTRARGVPPEVPEETHGVDLRARSLAGYRVAQTAADWVHENGLGYSMWSRFAENVEIPCEVMLALVPAGVGLPFDPEPPPLPRAPITPAQISSSAAGALTELLSTAMATLEALDRIPIASLKNGGVGVREITSLAKRLGVDSAAVRLALELARPLGLLGQNNAGKVLTAPRFDQWRESEPAHRAGDLILTWLGLAGTPTVDRDEEGRSLPALTTVGSDQRARVRREIVLAALANGPASTGLVAPGQLAAYLGWRMPLMLTGAARDEIERIWAEAETLGVAAHGALSDVGLAALGGEIPALLKALTDGLPAVQRTALFGSDLTVVVPGSPDAAVVDLLDTVAHREARGAASTWRITADSVRRAMDDGYGWEDLLERLRALADGDLPQALVYLVRDVGRRYGSVQVSPAGAVLVGDDVALLAELEVHKALRKLGLRRVAPTVLVAAAAPLAVVEALRGAGYLPRQVDEQGNTVIRVGAKRPRPPVPPERLEGMYDDLALPDGDLPLPDGDLPLPDDDLALADDFLDLWTEESGHAATEALAPESPTDAAARLAAGIPPAVPRSTALENEIAGSARRLSAEEVRQLAFATAHGGPVEIEHRATSGQRSRWVLSQLAVADGYLTGWNHGRAQEQRFALAKIVRVSPV